MVNLTKDECAILRALRDARGFCSSRGLAVCDVMARLKMKNASDAVIVESVLNSLARLGLARQVASGNWRRL